jgi:hypothetical protein
MAFIDQHPSRRPGACPRAARNADPWGPPQGEVSYCNKCLILRSAPQERVSKDAKPR